MSHAVHAQSRPLARRHAEANEPWQRADGFRSKLEAALQFLGRRLVTHPDSTFRPRRVSILDEFKSNRARLSTDSGA